MPQIALIASYAPSNVFAAVLPKATTLSMALCIPEAASAFKSKNIAVAAAPAAAAPILMRSQTSTARSFRSDIASPNPPAPDTRAGELVDEFARADDQRPDAGADQRAAQQDQSCGEPTDRQRRDSHPGDPTPCKKSHKSGGIGGQATDVVEETADRDAEWTGAAGHGRHGIRDRFQRRCRSHRQLVRQPAPDQAKPGDRVVRPLDLVGVLLGDDHPKSQNILGRLAKRRGVDPRHGDGTFLAEELAATAARSAAGTKSSIAALMAPTRWSNGRTISSLAESPSRSSASAAGPVPAAAWLRRRVRSLVACSIPDMETPASSPARSSVWIEATVVPSDCASFACASTGLKPRTDHGHARRRSCDNRCSRRDPDPPRERREPGVGRLHLAAEPPEPARPGLTDTFQLSTHLSAAHGRKADANRFSAI